MPNRNSRPVDARFIGRQLRRILLIALIGGFIGATLIRLSPGFGVDEEDMNARASHEARQEAHARHAGEQNIFAFYGRYLLAMVRGDLGRSHALNRPVAELIRERLPLTSTSLACGVGAGLAFGFFLALLNVYIKCRVLDWTLSLLGGACLSMPAGLIGLLFFWLNGQARWAIAIAVFPYVYRYSKNLLSVIYCGEHVLSARTRGLGELHILLEYILRPVAPQLVALAALTVSVGLGAAIPIEVVCDSPGLGQLVWRAALGRDLPVLVAATLLVAVITVAANSLADIALSLSPNGRMHCETTA